MHRSRSAPVLYYLPVSSNSSAQSNGTKSKNSSRTDLDSIVFYVPIKSLDANGLVSTAIPIVVNSTIASNSVDVGATAATTSPVYVASTASCNVSLISSAVGTIAPSPVSSASPKASLVSSAISSAVSIADSSSQVISATTDTSPRSIITGTTKSVLYGSTASHVATVVSTAASPVAITVSSATSSTAAAISSASSPKASPTVSESVTAIPVTTAVIPKPQVKRPAEKTIASLVFFDLETTGLAHEIGKSNVQITEISMIAISRKEFESSTSTELKDIRIIQKICLCTRPRSMVSSGAAKVTGLDNYNLIDQQPFDENVAKVITSFLTHLPKPVCLLAHNGACYDFPLLKAEFKRLSIHLPSDILIADTLTAFRELGVPVFPPDKKICKSVKFGKTGKLSYALANLYLYFFNKNPTGSHSSEGDCIALAKVCHRMKDLILPWVDENCFTIDTVTPMW